MTVRNLLFALCSASVLTACGGSSDSPRAVETPAPTTNTTVLTLRFDPSNSVIPLPNNLLLSGTRDLTLNIPVANPNNFGDPTVALNALDGWSTVTPGQFQFSVAPNAATVVPGQTVRVFEVSLSGPGGGVTGVTRELAAGAEFVTAPVPSDPSGRTFAIVWTRPLKQLTSYLVIVTNGIRAPDGTAATPDQTFFLAQRTSALCVGGVSTDPLLPNATACALEPLRQLTNSQLAAANSAGIPPANVVVSFAFTTQSISVVLQAVRSRAQAGVTRLAPTGLNTGAVGLPPVADIYIGTIDLPYYLVPPSASNPTGPLTGFWRAAPGAYVPPFNQFGLDPTSTHVTFANPFPVANATVTVPVLVTVPNAASGRTMPAAGWPSTIFTHGITRNRSDALAIAATMAAQGFAVVSMDQPLHGITDRASPFYIENSPFGAIANERTFDVDYVSNTTGAPGPDGVIDSSGTHFINLASLLTSRDNLRQSETDLSVLALSIPNMDLDSNGVGDFDGARIEFVGQSLGGIVGGVFLAIEPIVDTGLLNVAGGGIARLLDGSATFGPRIRAGLAAGAGLQPGTPNYDRFFGAAQQAVDSGDPINYGSASQNNNILLQEVLGDQVVPNTVAGAPLSGTEPLIRILGLPKLTATTQNPAGLDGVVRFTAGHHGSLLSPSATGGQPTADELAVTREMQGEMASFISTDGTTVVISNPSVIQP